MHSISVPNLPCPYSHRILYGTRLRLTGRRNRITAVSEASEVVFVPGDPELTWQIVVGTIAGVTPFVVAGIEFSKRIVAQKQCTECGGSGLVLIEKEYIRCPNCGTWHKSCNRSNRPGQVFCSAQVELKTEWNCL